MQLKKKGVTTTYGDVNNITALVVHPSILQTHIEGMNKLMMNLPWMSIGLLVYCTSLSSQIELTSRLLTDPTEKLMYNVQVFYFHFWRIFHSDSPCYRCCWWTLLYLPVIIYIWCQTHCVITSVNRLYHILNTWWCSEHSRQWKEKQNMQSENHHRSDTISRSSVYTRCL